ncbi:MAG TPA: cytochrome c peroxidase [Oligoflexus sp.]|uniref:cytochrome-c peroxidase n=1 Tax=Oligoflexus sp. TaxID=1971216 RepID=UPI002D5B539F|nr:cytochrome c peroxidase [Oligoflexus sp.]HYX34162.1 cytochrome c peroxidase [Oligoflexus sp.]
MGLYPRLIKIMVRLALLGLCWTEAGAQALRPIPPAQSLDMRLVKLGRMLFHDPRLSRYQDMSCAGCHPIGRGGADGVALSRGTGGAITTYNTPTIYNAALVLKYGWEGVATTLSEATQRALESPKAMDMKLAQAFERLRKDEELQRKFGPLQEATILQALIAYMEYLVPRTSAFDRFLQGDTTALSAEQQQGYQRFIELGCASCHQGVGIGGNMFVRFGVMVDLFRDQPELHRGRLNATEQPSDRHVFRVPSLRNVALTAPYFHDGRAADLASAVRTMGYVQLGMQLTETDLGQLLSFLDSLTGQLPDEVLP